MISETRSVFRAVLVPRLWHLTQSLHSRVFTQQTIPAILEAVLQSGGIEGGDYSLRLIGSYATQEHVCQYQESDFDFISRWMEREGLYYYFEQGDGAERLIITDSNASHKPLGSRPVRYFPQPEGTAHGRDTFRAFTCRHSSLPASVRLKDYDYASRRSTSPARRLSLRAVSARSASTERASSRGGRPPRAGEGGRVEERQRRLPGLRHRPQPARRLHVRARGAPAGRLQHELPGHRARALEQPAPRLARARGDHLLGRVVSRGGHRRDRGRSIAPRSARRGRASMAPSTPSSTGLR